MTARLVSRPVMIAPMAGGAKPACDRTWADVVRLKEMLAPSTLLVTGPRIGINTSTKFGCSS